MADAGEFISMKDGILLNLNQGSIHENSTVNKEYRKTFFNNYKIAIPFDELGYNDANNLVRQEREMNIHLLMEKNDYFKKKKAKEKNDLVKNNKLLISLNDSIKFLNKETKNILSKNKLNKKINITKKKIEKNKRLIPIYTKEMNKFAVEIHKKFSVPFACIIFVLLGMPLGILAKKSNMGVSVSISLVVFIIYWCFLILGEELADNTIINPIIAMWAPNIFLALLSYYLYSLISKENITLKINLLNFFKK